MSNQAVPEGMPSLPFGMKWEFPGDGNAYATIHLDLGTKIMLSVNFDPGAQVRKEDMLWYGHMSISMLDRKKGFGIRTPNKITQQEAALAAAYLLAPFVQLSKMGHD